MLAMAPRSLRLDLANAPWIISAAAGAFVGLLLGALAVRAVSRTSRSCQPSASANAR
jgi:hypothetical protein